MSIPAFDRPAEFELARFASPPAIDRGAPFWSLNGRLDADRMVRQFGVYAEMGIGGMHLHPRTGLSTEYMGEEFLACIRASVDEAERRGMHAWLYDEDRWPSGFAGGLVTAQLEHRIRHLRITRRPIAAGESIPFPTHHTGLVPLDTRRFVTAWALTFEDGLLRKRRRIDEGESVATGEVPLYAYLEVAPDSTWFNNTQYVDTLNPVAMRRFIDETHERYKQTLGDRFGTVVPAIFTDEPLFRGMEFPASMRDDRDRCISWTDDLPDTFRAVYGEDLLDVLPDVLFDRVDGRQRRARWLFHNHHTDRFVEAFAEQLGSWCADNGIGLTGHMMEEPTLGRQTRWVGEAMRSLRHFQLPGIDMLCDAVELTTAKQAQSVARQTGAPGTMSELYGVTNWDFPFAGHKRQGDWQAALGVVTRVHHLTWYQMGGEAKRDYPASIGEHSPWWRRYSVIEDHFARVNTALRSGTPRCRVAMIHPIESYWLVHGPSASERERQRLEDGFSETLRWMLEDLIDVDLVSEADLVEQDTSDAGGFRVGAMTYDAVVVPPVVTLRRTTVSRLAGFAANAGTVIVLDGGPELIDAEVAVAPADLARFTQIGWQRSALLAALEPLRELRLLASDGSPAVGVVHQLRSLPDGGVIVFLTRFDQDPRYSLDNAVLEVRGRWETHDLDTSSGTERDRPAVIEGDWTRIPVDLPIAGHVLLRLSPGIPAFAPEPRPAANEVARLPDPVDVELLEENVLVLDRAEWRLDAGEWQPTEEILRIDNAARAMLGRPRRSGSIAQPWTEAPAAHDHRVTVAFSIHVEHATGPVRLAVEEASDATITLDGTPIDAVADGTWIDEAFTPVRLPALSPGEHRLEIERGFGGSGGLEACYLTGDFGVTVSGTHATITRPVRALTWGNATIQGLAFYGGTIRYRVRVRLPEGSGRHLAVEHAAGALVDVRWPGSQPMPIYRAPWSTPIPDDLSGEVELTIDCYGTRINTFGQLHNVATDYRWWGPRSWRTTGDQWADEYQLRPTGVLVAPRVLQR